MDWNRTAPGCAPIRPTPEVAGPPTHSRTLHEGELYFRPGAIAAEWMRENDTVWAVFYESPAGHELCLWDTAGI
ncbi:MAG: hypothetical protein Q8L86_11060 [Vicinamibacterales bacterium]|nr:hypothetical protein [Vicinamibacterales bacterium]